MWLVVAAPLVLLVGAYWWWYHGKWLGYKLPPGPARSLLAGNVTQLDEKRADLTMREWGKEYGGLYTIWYGYQPAIVITDYNIIKEALVGQADNFSRRAYNFLFEHFVGQYGIINTSGQVWKEQRRFSLHTLRDFGFGRKEMEERILQSIAELHANIQGHLEESSSAELCLGPHIQQCSGNIISSLVLGHTFSRADGRLTLLEGIISRFFMALVEPGAILLNSFPFLHHVPILNSALGYYRMGQYQLELDNFVLHEISASRRRWEEDPTDTSNFVASYLAEMKRRQDLGDSDSFSEKMLLFTVSDLFVAGSTPTTLPSPLLNNTSRLV